MLSHQLMELSKRFLNEVLELLSLFVHNIKRNTKQAACCVIWHFKQGEKTMLGNKRSSVERTAHK